LSGLEDVSHEEVRLKAYEAQKAGTFDNYVSTVVLSAEYDSANY